MSVVVSLSCVTVALGSCDLAKNQLTFDRSGRKDLQDYRDALSPDPKAAQEAAAAPSASMPDFQSVVSTPADLKLPSPLVTVSVNQTVSLRDLMFELAEQAGVDLEMDPNVRGSIIFTAKERPFSDVVDRICAMSGLRYTYENGVLRVELDRPYVKDYKLDYMSSSRSSASKIDIGLSNSSSSDSTTSNTGSTSTVESKMETDFWKDLDAGLKQVLASSDNYKALATDDDPVAVPEPAPLPPPQLDASGNPLPAPVPPPIATAPPSLNVSTPAAAASPAAMPGTYSISRQTGIVSVFASERQHKLVQKFVESYRRQSMTQVLIEAKIMEVQLDDQFSTGVDWGQMKSGLGATLALSRPAHTLTNTSLTGAGASVFTLDLNLGDNYRDIVSALSYFGTVRALSSPRVMVLNNQPAVVNVANNLVYFDIKVTTSPSTAVGVPPTITYDSTRKSVPEGVLMTVVPTANAETGEVVLSVRPTISRKISEVTDPSIALSIISSGGDAEDIPPSAVPQMAVKEIDSIVKMQSGQTMVMGGLMQDSNTTANEGVPILADLPIIGNAFRNHNDRILKSELVIFIKASIVPGSSVDEQDRKLYHEFGNDTHPTQM